MKVFTIGSGIVKESIAKYGSEYNLQWVGGVTDVSPFCFLVNNARSMKVEAAEVSCVADLEAATVDIELGKDIEIPQDVECIVIDILEARKNIHEYTLSDNSRYVISDESLTGPERTNAFKRAIETKCGKIIAERGINSTHFTDEEIENTMGLLADWFKEKHSNCKVVLQCNHYDFGRFVGDGDYMVLPYTKAIMELNAMFDKCTMQLLSKLDCKAVVSPQISFVDATKEPKCFTEVDDEYLEYMCKVVKSVLDEDERLMELRQEYFDAIHKKAEALAINYTMKRALKKAGDRHFLFCNGDETLIDATAKKFGIGEYDKITLTDNYEEDVQLLNSYDSEKTVVIVPKVSITAENIKVLKDCGYEKEKTYFTTKHQPVEIKDYIGIYRDCFGNSIECYSSTNINIKGISNVLKTGKNGFTRGFCYELGDANSILVEAGVRCNQFKPLLIFCRDATSLYIGRDTSFVNGCEIIAGDFANIHIGAECMFSSDVLVKGSRNTSIDGSNRVMVGNHVWAGYRSCLLTGCSIGDGCIIGARGVVCGYVPNNCLVAGNPHKILKKNVAWHRNLFEDDINALPEEYRRLTQ